MFDPDDVLEIRVCGRQGTYPHEKFRIYAEAQVEWAITKRWPDLKAGDELLITVRRVEPLPRRVEP